MPGLEREPHTLISDILPPRVAALGIEVPERGSESAPHPAATGFDDWFDLLGPADQWNYLAASLQCAEDWPSIYDAETRGALSSRLRIHIETLDNRLPNDDNLTDAAAHFLFATASLADHQPEDPLALLTFCTTMDTLRSFRRRTGSDQLMYMLARIMYGLPRDQGHAYSTETERVLDELGAVYMVQAATASVYEEGFPDGATAKELAQHLAHLHKFRRVMAKLSPPTKYAVPEHPEAPSIGELIITALAAREDLTLLAMEVKRRAQEAQPPDVTAPAPKVSWLERLGSTSYQSSPSADSLVAEILKDPAIREPAALAAGRLAAELDGLAHRLATGDRTAIITDLQVLGGRLLTVPDASRLDFIDERASRLERLQVLAEQRAYATGHRLAGLNIQIEQLIATLGSPTRPTASLANGIAYLQLDVAHSVIDPIPQAYVECMLMARIDDASKRLAALMIGTWLEIARQGRVSDVEMTSFLAGARGTV